MIIHDTLTCQPACRGGAGRSLFLQSIYLQSIYLSSYKTSWHDTWRLSARTGGTVSLEPETRGKSRGKQRKLILVGAVADPTTHPVFKVAVGRVTPSISLRAVRLSNGVPANTTGSHLTVRSGSAKGSSAWTGKRLSAEN